MDKAIYEFKTNWRHFIISKSSKKFFYYHRQCGFEQFDKLFCLFLIFISNKSTISHLCNIKTATSEVKCLGSAKLINNHTTSQNFQMSFFIINSESWFIITNQKLALKSNKCGLIYQALQIFIERGIFWTKIDLKKIFSQGLRGRFLQTAFCLRKIIIVSALIHTAR